MMNICQVNLAGRAYPIYIGENLLNNLTDLLSKHIVGKQVMVVTNQTLENLYLPKLRQALKDYQCSETILPDGEQYKDFTQLQTILDNLLANQHHRNTTLIALGGGVVGDITGFAAAIYQRGVAFIQMPTSLLAQVDASVGGKTAINHRLGKNMIGAFHQPNAVIIDIAVLLTLPEREYRAGLAEVIKYGLLGDAGFFEWIEKNAKAILAKEATVLLSMIERCCQIKAEIVAEDEKEISGRRALLNLGHTFAHAIEVVYGYENILHGEAVAQGLFLAAKLSHQLENLTNSEVQRIYNCLESLGFKPEYFTEQTADKLIHVMHLDKKVEAKELTFVLMKEIGGAVVCKGVAENQVRKVF